MNKKLSSRKAARKVHSKTMKRKNLSKKMKKMKKTKKVRFSRKKKIRGGAAAGGIGSFELHSGPLKNKGAALLYLLLNPKTRNKVMNTTEKEKEKDLSPNERRLKMVNDILQYVEHEKQLRTYIGNREALTKGEADTIRKVLELMLGNITTYYNHNNFADTYYYDEVLYLAPQGLRPITQESIRNQFQFFLKQEIQKVLDEDLNTGKIDEALFKLSGLNDQIFKNITYRMKTFIVAVPGINISFEDINLLESYKAKEYFYELLEQSIQSYQTAQSYKHIMNQFRDTIKIFQDKRKKMYDNIHQKFAYFLKVTQDPVFVSTKTEEIIRHFNYYVTDIQNEAHRQLIEFYSSGHEHSLLLSIRDSLIKKVRGIINGIKLTAQNAVRGGLDKMTATTKKAYDSFYESAIPHILYGLTDQIIFDAFARASLSGKPFMSREQVVKFKQFKDQLEHEINLNSKKEDRPQNDIKVVSTKTKKRPVNDLFRTVSARASYLNTKKKKEKNSE